LPDADLSLISVSQNKLEKKKAQQNEHKTISYILKMLFFFSFSQHQFYHNHENRAFNVISIKKFVIAIERNFIIFCTFIVKDLKQLVADILSHTRD
jgi:hypothetical protein